jgi:iron complex transport system substrate-binding protein
LKILSKKINSVGLRKQKHAQSKCASTIAPRVFPRFISFAPRQEKAFSRWAIKLLSLVTFVFFLFGCKNENPPIKNEKPTREITDDLGRRVKIPQRIERAVSLAPNLTEIAFAVGAGDKLVGVTSFCNYPEEAAKIQKIGDTMNPNIESIIALKPQIVLVSTASQIETFTETLERQNIEYFVTNPQNLDGIYKSIRQIGEIFGDNQKSNAVVDELKKRVADVETRITPGGGVKVFLQISKEPLYTVGKDSFMTDLITRAGGVSVTGDVPNAYPKLSKETALALNPEAIILSESEDNQTQNEVFKNSPAVKNNKVFKINADIISRPAPRIVEALEQIAKALHPENFQ